MANEMAVPEESPSTFSAKHDKFPELKNAKLGDIVEVKVKGKVVNLHAASQYSKGSTEIEVESGQNKEDDNPETMPLEKLREKLPKKQEEDEE